MTSLTDRLVAAVRAAPDRDEPRHVLADHLLERGDPWGEVLSLQLARAASGDAAATIRERSLVKRHWRDWCGTLGRHLGHRDITFERGFLASATLPSPKLDRPSWLAPMVGDPAWATVRTLAGPARFELRRRGRRPLLQEGVALLVHPVLRGLRELRDLPARLVAALPRDVHPDLWALGLRLEREPIAELAGAWTRPLWPTVTRMSIDFGDRRDPAEVVAAALEASVRTVEVRGVAGYRAGGNTDWWFRAERDASGAVASVDLSQHAGNDLVALLGRVRPRSVRVACHSVLDTRRGQSPLETQCRRWQSDGVEVHLSTELG